MPTRGIRLPQGVELVSLTPHSDERGTFTELFRDEWALGVAPTQWNAVRSDAGVLRGVHAHLSHADYLTVPLGEATIGLRDLRPASPTHGLSTTVQLGSDHPAALTIPPGVAHGFLFHAPSLHVYAVSHYWDKADELGCRWDDGGLEIPWPAEPRLVSSRDAGLGTLAQLKSAIATGIAPETSHVW